MIKKVSKYIARHHLLTNGALHLVALSGGADSVALLHVLRCLGYKVEAAHCNFRLRGDESDRDEQFCRRLCDKLQVRLHTAHFDTLTYSRLHHVSIEMAARDLRYSYFYRLADDIGAEDICVAHHKDDNAETVLMNLVRGTGVNGLGGIHPRNGRTVRPLLCVGRQEILDYLQETGQDYVTDSSNLVDDVKRNKVRLNVMPMLKQMNPSVIDAINATAERLADIMPLLKDATERQVSDIAVYDRSGGVEVDIAKLMSSPSPSHILYTILEQYNCPSNVITEIGGRLGSRTGAGWTFANHAAVIDRGKLIVSALPAPQRPLKLPICGRYTLANGETLVIETAARHELSSLRQPPSVALLDTERVKMPLLLRKVEEGDRFTPFGMKGTKLVSDFLTDMKMPLHLKQRQLCLLDATQRIVWVVGQRISDNCRVSAGTRQILKMTFVTD